MIANIGHVLIHNGPDDTIELHKVESEAERPLEQELRELLEKNKPFTPEERLAIARMIRGRSKGLAPSLSLAEIREGLK